MKRIVSIMALMLLQISCYAVTVETTNNLNVYYPEYSKIDLVCGQMPKAAQKDVELCCEAAFTGELLNEFKHSNIADNHICNGVLKKGYRCKANTVVPINVLFSNSFLKDLDLLWELREWIPDPTKPILPPNRLHH